MLTKLQQVKPQLSTVAEFSCPTNLKDIWGILDFTGRGLSRYIRTLVIKPGCNHLWFLSLSINLAAWVGRPHVRWMIFSMGTPGFMRLLLVGDCVVP